ncbi:MAG: hypothetical protein LJE60_11225 [Thiocapsa sp.]|nr:hypothetical protein [Thiocapsa sp.]MCG6897660.1 hypothetical protein [Thiocapsa sp.]
MSPPNEAPFRLTFEAPDGERMGILAYAFLANARATRNRPCDEHRFQLKYGSKDGQLHELWQDPFQLYTTLLFGINPGTRVLRRRGSVAEVHLERQLARLPGVAEWVRLEEEGSPDIRLQVAWA